MEELYPYERTEELLLYSVINEPIYAIEEVFNSGPLETTDHLFLLEAMEFTKGYDVDEIDGARLILIGIVSAIEGELRSPSIASAKPMQEKMSSDSVFHTVQK
jgi:hypothetical protein